MSKPLRTYLNSSLSLKQWYDERNNSEYTKEINSYLKELGVSFDVLKSKVTTERVTDGMGNLTYAQEWSIVNVNIFRGHEVIRAEQSFGLHWVAFDRRTELEKQVRSLKATTLRNDLTILSLASYDMCDWSVTLVTLSDIVDMLVRSWLEDNSISFKQWCWQYGYNDDSIKDLEYFEYCKKVTADVNRMFSIEEIEKLKVLFEDY